MPTHQSVETAEASVSQWSAATDTALFEAHDDALLTHCYGAAKYPMPTAASIAQRIAELTMRGL